MNKTYALVWNSGQGVWQVAGERARRRGKASTRTRRMLAVACVAGGAMSAAHALPVGENVVSGSADILRYDNGRQMSINQHSDKLLTEWSSFNVDAGQRVKFNQPSASSIALNRVVGQQGSAIHGSIDANGRVFLVNPNGILFGNGAQVNVGGLVASTLDIKNADFAAGNYRFSGSSIGNIQNSGSLVAAEGGAIALLGAQVVNRGVVQAQMGTVALAAGDAITLNFDGSKLLNVQVDERAVDALASNERLLKADGGQVLMSARTANALLQTVVNNQGAIEARTLRNSAGRISLDGHDAGTVNVAGTLNASATTPGNGGTIDTRGADVKVALGTTVDTRATNGRNGVWRIASSDLSVTPGASRQGTIVADTLSRNLGMTDIELVAEQGKLSVDGPVNWATGNQLMLTSRQGDVAVNGALRATGANAGVAIDAAQGAQINAPVALTGANARFKLDYVGTYSLGNSASVTLSGAGAGFESNGFLHTVIQTLAQLQAINANLGGLYVLGNDIAGGYYNTTFQTIGADTPFSGVFDGLGHSVSRLSITSGSPYAGLFGLNTGRIANLVLKSSSVGAAAGPGPVSIGAVAGENRGEIANVVVSDNTLVRAGASRSNVLGGLVGINRGSVAQSSFTGRVEGNGMTYAAGGLVGEQAAPAGRAEDTTISDSMANATVSGGAPNAASLGGLVGVNRGGTIRNGTSLGSTSAAGLSGVNVGGLVGANLAGGIVQGTASGRTTGGTAGTAGGFVGYNAGTIWGALASGVVDGRSAQAIGGFVGMNLGSVTGSKALGAVTSASSGATGGFVGINQGRDALIDDAQAHGTVSGGQGTVGGFVGSHLNGTIAHSVARGKTTGGNYSKTGGFAGYNESVLADNDASGDVSAGMYASVGGFAGTNATSGTLAVASATGNVQGSTSGVVGGLVGDNLGEIFGSSASGTVSGGCQATLGGLVGLNAGLVESSAASGRVNNSAYSSWQQVYGGLVGVNRGTFRWSHAVGAAAQQKIAGVNLGVIEQ
ncbi:MULTISPECIES: two-partner secretion domain-containing protein [Burkholderia]|uniref:two-partner secretion domain-containing protein n=1 Tax=Burkholderia TaxID=32008 RepID=UPI00064F5DDD|nr:MULTISPECIES: filamentous hemagglutinin N-terminal domain-containing protein [Burkholderia]KML10179.1 filamentous hemagglutinin [Burkholderia cepacia]KML45494.1 filamentous hemagglutinin [Burkholderia lata]KMN59147.1 filamentous hemagglutinin [Burkholderia sp. LK4]